jgi:hypothetical protein
MGHVERVIRSRPLVYNFSIENWAEGLLLI